ncbi:DUF6210 family protein [Microbulbifer sp. CNSA002]|uniref:DUF6210 family protein n=1 Tax=unclassified Microbulbifer TaxID=2619833 RepID=UPI0039B5981A
MGDVTRRVSLWDMAGCALIILEKTGVVYFNQVGGTACLSEEAEGFLCPVNREDGSLESCLTKLFSNVNKIDPDVVDEEFKKHAETSFISLDKKVLGKSCESWLYVNITPGLSDLLSGVNSVNAILTWPNSD